jgi:hypothetical protein
MANAISIFRNAIVVCALATFSAIQEGHLIRIGELNGKGGYWI